MTTPIAANPASSGAPGRRALRSRTTPEPVSRLILTDRDRELLADLYLHGIMSRAQLASLFFGSVSRCNARLRQLFDHEFLTRPSLPIIAQTAPTASQAIYAIGKEAVPVVASYLSTSGADLDTVYQGYRRTLTPSYVEHSLAIVDIRLAFRAAIKASPGVRLDRWLPELQCRHEYTLTLENGEQRTEVFKPDGFVRLTFPDYTYHCFFLEVDLGHTSQAQFLGKLQGHTRYQDPELFFRSYGAADARGTDSYHTLVVTTSLKRIENLIALVENEMSDLFWFTTFDQIKASGVLGPIWQVPFSKYLNPLLPSRP